MKNYYKITEEQDERTTIILIGALNTERILPFVVKNEDNYSVHVSLKEINDVRRLERLIFALQAFVYGIQRISITWEVNEKADVIDFKNGLINKFLSNTSYDSYKELLDKIIEKIPELCDKTRNELKNRTTL